MKIFPFIGLKKENHTLRQMVPRYLNVIFLTGGDTNHYTNENVYVNLQAGRLAHICESKKSMLKGEKQINS